MGTRHLRALVADDDPDIVSLVAHTLEQLYDIEVTCATTGGDLLQMLSEAPFDVVITDVAMPWMTGLQVMHSARAAGLTTPIVVMTALRDERVTETAAALGQRAAFLQKPFRIVELRAAIEHAIGGTLDVRQPIRR